MRQREQRLQQRAFATHGLETGGTDPPHSRRAGHRRDLRTGAKECRRRAADFVIDHDLVPREHLQVGTARRRLGHGHARADARSCPGRCHRADTDSVAQGDREVIPVSGLVTRDS
jgi:hypothetical protein